MMGQKADRTGPQPLTRSRPWVSPGLEWGTRVDETPNDQDQSPSTRRHRGRAATGAPDLHPVAPLVDDLPPSQRAWLAASSR